ncbi:hypothetical protein KIN20_018172 [Parelaphostrongylus tenuis]|uniref:Uncharacterized protein n=1 Tax=Parelaphostrongylus tenuis TaxID=148309 RepID=A0AAD5QRX8_PARTN|nr:hypothetical protein KIN20_018172 [Parelaphostrongylus tenuis]
MELKKRAEAGVGAEGFAIKWKARSCLYGEPWLTGSLQCFELRKFVTSFSEECETVETTVIDGLKKFSNKLELAHRDINGLSNQCIVCTKFPGIYPQRLATFDSVDASANLSSLVDHKVIVAYIRLYLNVIGRTKRVGNCHHINAKFRIRYSTRRHGITNTTTSP